MSAYDAHYQAALVSVQTAIGAVTLASNELAVMGDARKRELASALHDLQYVGRTLAQDVAQDDGAPPMFRSRRIPADWHPSQDPAMGVM